MKQWRV